MKQIKFTLHAKQKIKERNIKKTTVQRALIKPDELINSRNGTKIVQKVKNSKMLRIIFRDEEDSYLVITAYYTKQERYEVKK